MYVYVDDTYMYILTYINQLTTGWWFKSPAQLKSENEVRRTSARADCCTTSRPRR